MVSESTTVDELRGSRRRLLFETPPDRFSQAMATVRGELESEYESTSAERRAALAELASGLAIDVPDLHQLQVEVAAGHAQDDRVDVRSGMADERADVLGPWVPSEDLLEAEDVAVEVHRPVQVGHAEPGVVRALDRGHRRLLLRSRLGREVAVVAHDGVAGDEL